MRALWPETLYEPKKHQENIDIGGGSRSLLIYQAGVDGLQGDRFGRWALTRRGLQKRNAFLYSLASECRMPLLITMGGGYHKDIRETVRASADVYLQAAAWEQCSEKIAAHRCDAESMQSSLWFSQFARGVQLGVHL